MADRGRGRGEYRGRGRGDGGGGFRGRGGYDGGGGGRGRGGYDGGGGGGFRGRGGFRGDRGGDRGGIRGGRGGFESPRVFGAGTNIPQPDAEVTKQENAMVKGDLSSALAASSLDLKLPARPAYGKDGTAIVLYTNYLELKGIGAEPELYRYSVTFQSEKGKNPQTDKELSKSKKKRLVELLLQMEPFAGLPIASDWAQTLVTPKKIPMDDQGAYYKIEWYPFDGEPPSTQNANDSDRGNQARLRNTHTVYVQLVGTVSIKELLKDLAQPTSNYPLKLETIQALNIIMAYGPSRDHTVTTAGGNKFYPFGNHPHVETTPLGGGLEAVRGYYSSVRTSVSRILVNINVATGAFYRPGPLLDVMNDIVPARFPTNEITIKKLAAFVHKLRFETNYIPEREKGKGGKVKKDAKGKIVTKRKVHVIANLSSSKMNARTTKFSKTNQDGSVKTVSVEEHFMAEYNIRLSQPLAPLVNYGTAKDVKWIPAELCVVLPGQLAKRLLYGPQTSEMIRFAARRPHQNAESITGDGLKVTKITPVTNGLNTALVPFGIKVNPSLLTVPGRILQPPQLMYRGSVTCNPRNGAWNLDPRVLGPKPFRLAKPLGEWDTLLINCDGRDTITGGLDGAFQHLTAFRSTLETYGLSPGPLRKPVTMDVKSFDLQNKEVARIQEQLTAAVRKFSRQPNFLFVILPSDSPVLYDSIKFVFDCKLGIPNVCNIGSKFSKERGQMQYFANVTMKFNQKLKGVNHTVDMTRLAPLDSQTILFGVDVTHPSPGSSDSAPSIAGVVASVDSTFGQYPASMRTQRGREEMVEELEEMIIERLRLWQQRNQNRLPRKVIVYRDGVSESQYRIVLESEYPAFLRAFTRLYGAESKHPKIAIVVVGKRHHSRFFPSKEADTDGKTGNPQPGTIVDRGVTGEKLFDFFLLAHQGLQGTSKPAHYIVLKDEIGLGADQLQKLTHHLCYTFARATRSISICPPAYYADLLCERGRAYLQGVLKGDGSETFSANSGHWRKDVHPRLMDTMYYL